MNEEYDVLDNSSGYDDPSGCCEQPEEDVLVTSVTLFFKALVNGRTITGRLNMPLEASNLPYNGENISSYKDRLQSRYIDAIRQKYGTKEVVLLSEHEYIEYQKKKKRKKEKELQRCNSF